MDYFTDYNSFNTVDLTNLELSDTEYNDLMENIEFKLGNLQNLLKKNKTINVLWGVQPRNLPNLEFIIAVLQIVKFIKNGFIVTVLIADIHEILDSPNISLHILKYRGKAYAELISHIVDIFDANSNNLKFVFGSEFQTSPQYTMDIYRISSNTTIKETYKSREIDITDIDISVKSNEKKMTSMLYPILQALDEKYTECDIFYGSITQKNMCIFSNNLMKNIRNKDKEVVYLLQDLTHKINISFFDPIDTIEYKLNDFTLTELYYIVENVLYPILRYKNDKFKIKDITLDKYDDFDKHFNQYVKNETQIEETKMEIIKITAQYLSKHLDKLYFNLISSRFMDYYQTGWIGVLS
jgi:hypothetical protein